MTRLHVPVSLRWSDLDAYAHVNNVEMFRLLEDARITAFWTHPDAGEDAWPMPIPEYMDGRVHSSTIADLAQYDGIRWGGGLFAAAFLREFTGGLPWAHLDIAGPTYNKGGPVGHLASGATGYGVATLIELLERTARAAG